MADEAVEQQESIEHVDRPEDHAPLVDAFPRALSISESEPARLLAAFQSAQLQAPESRVSIHVGSKHKA